MFVFTLNLYGNAQAGALLILHIAMCVFNIIKIVAFLSQGPQGCGSFKNGSFNDDAASAVAQLKMDDSKGWGERVEAGLKREGAVWWGRQGETDDERG